MIKNLICWIFGHKWIEKIRTGIHPGPLGTGVDYYYDVVYYERKTCRRCGEPNPEIQKSKTFNGSTL